MSSTKWILLEGDTKCIEDCKDVTMTNPSLVRVALLQEHNCDE